MEDNLLLFSLKRSEFRPLFRWDKMSLKDCYNYLPSEPVAHLKQPMQQQP